MLAGCTLTPSQAIRKARPSRSSACGRMRSAMPSTPAAAGSMPSATKTRRRQCARELVAVRDARHALGRAGDLGDLVRGALADEARDERAALAAGDRGDEEPGQAGRAGRQRDLLVAEQHEPEADDERHDRADRRVARALRQAREHGSGGVRIDGVVVDDGGERLGHGACIGRFRQIRTPSIEGLPGRAGTRPRRLGARSHGTSAARQREQRRERDRARPPRTPGGRERPGHAAARRRAPRRRADRPSVERLRGAPVDAHLPARIDEVGDDEPARAGRRDDDAVGVARDDARRLRRAPRAHDARERQRASSRVTTLRRSR